MYSAGKISVLLLFIISCSPADRNKTTIINNKPVADTISLTIDTINTTNNFYNIYFTFDDGPLEGSSVINAISKEDSVCFNVFIVGAHVFKKRLWQTYYESYKINPFIEIGNHSFSHAAYNHYKIFYCQPAKAFQDFLKNDELLHLPSKLCRLPARNMWRLGDTLINGVNSGASVADSLFHYGYRVFGWDLEWEHDSKTGEPLQSADQMIQQIFSKLQKHQTMVKDNIVILAHDEMFQYKSAESALKSLVYKLKATGRIRFLHLSNYPLY